MKFNRKILIILREIRQNEELKEKENRNEYINNYINIVS